MLRNRINDWPFVLKQLPGLFGNFVSGPFEYERAQYPSPSHMSLSFLAKLKESALPAAEYPKRATLFEDGQKSRGLYVILEGRAKVFMEAAHGKSLILGFFGPGTILGLEAALLGREHISTAEVVMPAKVAFIDRTDLLENVRSDATASLDLARLTAEACYFAMGRMRALDLSLSAEQRLARFFFEAAADGVGTDFVMLGISQEAVAQMLGLARETVARLISNLKRKGILNWKRSGIFVRDWQALATLARAPEWPRCGNRAAAEGGSVRAKKSEISS